MLSYLASHPDCTIMQIVRGTGADRRHVQRMIRVIEKNEAGDFCRIGEAAFAA